MDDSAGAGTLQAPGGMPRLFRPEHHNQHSVAATIGPDAGASADFLGRAGRTDAHLLGLNEGAPPVHFRGAIAAAIIWAARENRKGTNIYFTPNVARAGVGKKAKRADIESVLAAYADVDAKDGRTLAACESKVYGLPLPPTTTVMTGGGVQGIWTLNPPVVPADFPRVEAINKAIAKACGGDAVQNVDRILRLPGTVNWPNERKRDAGRVPALARVISQTGRSYTLAQMEAAFVPCGSLATLTAASSLDAPTLPACFTPDAAALLAALDPGWSTVSPHFGAGIQHREPSPVTVLASALKHIATEGGMMAESTWTEISMAAARCAHVRPAEKDAIYSVLDAASQVAGGNYNKGENRRRFERFVREAASRTGFDDRMIISRALQLGWQAPSPTLVQSPSASSALSASVGLIGVTDFPPVPPKREWLHGTDIVRCAVSLVVAPGGRGKSALLLGTALACATGKPLMGSHIFAPPGGLRVLYINNEDGTGEIGRRVRAAMMHHGLSDADCSGLKVGGVDRMRLSLLRAERGDALPDEAGWTELKKVVEEERPDVLLLDPLANLSAASLNDNHAATMLMARLTALAVRHSMGIVVAHHTAKGRDLSSQEAASGAAAIVNSARVSMALEPLAETEAMKVGVLPSEAWRYFSVGQVKGNLAPVGTRRLFKLESVDLLNAQPPIYPHGDSVQVVVPFTPFAGPMRFSDAVLRAAEAAIGGAKPPLSPAKQAGARYAVPTIARAIAPHLPSMTTVQVEEVAKEVLDALRSVGRVVVKDVHIPKPGGGGANRKQGLVVQTGGSPEAGVIEPGASVALVGLDAERGERGGAPEAAP